MLPSASVSLPSRTQKKLFAFSGSSVASGASTSERISTSAPRPSATATTSSTNMWAPPTIAARPSRNWMTTSRVGGSSCGVESMISGMRCRSRGSSVSSRWTLPAAAQRRDDIAGVSEHEDARGHGLEAVGHAEPEREADGEEPEEDGEVALHGLGVDVEPAAGRAPALVGQRGDPDEEHRDRREQERRADDRADRDVVGPLRPAEDRDERDQALGHRRPDGREQAPHRALAERQLVPEPLDGVGERSAPTRITAKLAASRTYLA